VTNRAPLGTQLPKPFCSACGHDLTGAVNSANCPECGRPLVEVLVRPSLGFNQRLLSRRYESKTRIFGMPLVSIATGTGADGKRAHAKGFVALGDTATGVFALGGLARGVVSLGGASFGIVSFGGLSVGTLASFGGLSIAFLGSAVGGFAAGILAAGGGAVGLFAQGGLAIGWLARGDKAIGANAWGRGITPDAASQAVFDQYAWLVGPPGAMPQPHYHLMWSAVIVLTVATLALLLLVARRPQRDLVAEELTR
jgi:predicted RNA-binding Zn-ribbon protein involved in translation (DUF1610 family)